MDLSKNFVVANWKMNLSLQEAKDLSKAFVSASKGLSGVETWIAAPSIFIPAVQDELRGNEIKLGSQNVHWEKSGAFTGELSVEMLRQYECSFALTGHSERRHVMGESIEQVDKRTVGSLGKDFATILCVGETAQERSEGMAEKVVSQQLNFTLSNSKLENLIIAYEPVWAIGTGDVAEPADVNNMHNFIRSKAPRTPILYGGSVNPENFEELIAIENVSGALVGGASLKAEKFTKLMEIANQC